MGTIAEKLDYMKTNIDEMKGLTGESVLADVVERVKENYDGNDVDYWSTHPIEYWERFRPKEYPRLPVPMENEIYMTVELNDTEYNYFSFVVDTKLMDYMVEVGDMVNGEFVAESSESVAKNTAYLKLFDRVEDRMYKVIKVSCGKEDEIRVFALKDCMIKAERQKYRDFRGNLIYCVRNGIRFESNNYLENVYLILNDIINIPAVILYGTSLKSVYISFLDWSNCKSLAMFLRFTSALHSINFQDFEVSLTNVSQMVNGTVYMTKIDVSKMDVSNCTDFYSVFAGCRMVRRIDGIEAWNVSEGTSFADMFRSCINLEEIDLSNWSLSKGKDFKNMFAACGGLADLRLPALGVRGDISFLDCVLLSYGSLMSILHGLYDFSSDTGVHSLVLGATNLAKLSEEDLQIGQDKGWTIS